MGGQEIGKRAPNLIWYWGRFSGEDAVKRVLALFLVLIFLGGVALTSWPVLYLPSLDFIFQTPKLSRDAQIQQLQSAVVHLTVLARPEDPARYPPLIQRRGTGFNVDPAGIIITNYHVVRDAARIVVTFPDGGIYNADHWSGKQEWDLAVLELAGAPQQLPFTSLGDSSQSTAGEPITIIGNPLGLENILIRGTLGPTLSLPECETPVLQLDALIHPGNSGSPVIDRSNRVIGVVFGTFKSGDETRGLALPANQVREYLDSEFYLSQPD
jgi:S1-C subfamily serine protease